MRREMMTRDIFESVQPTWSNFIVCQQCSNRSKNEISSLLINLLTKCLPHNDHVTDLEQCLSWVQLDLSPLFVNLSHELAQTMTRYYCLGTEQSEFEQCLNWLQLYLILLLVKCSNKLAQVIAKYDILTTMDVILSHV